MNDSNLAGQSSALAFWHKNKKKIIIAIALCICFFGIGMRFYHIAQNDFVFYDEGYYLNFNRFFYDIVVANYPDNPGDMLKALSLWSRLSLGTGKFLWFLLSDSRVFFGAYDSWFFPRVLAAISGALTLLLIYAFSRKFYEFGSDPETFILNENERANGQTRPQDENARRRSNSTSRTFLSENAVSPLRSRSQLNRGFGTTAQWVGLLSVVLLAILPSHVFYSRLAMQESFSTLCFLGGFYLYLFPRRFGYKTFLSAALFACAFFTNYRLITLPVHMAFCELFLCFMEKRLPDFRKYIWHIVTFFGFVFVIGNLDQAQNTVVTFAWMFYQSNLAKQQFDWLNFMSYPYYLFRLEHGLFALLFFGNIYYFFRKKWKWLLPFGLACLHMGIYSFAGEKGARYLCVVLPFIVMSAASLIVHLFEERPNRFFRMGVAVFLVLTVLGLSAKSIRITRAKSDYRAVMENLLAQDKNIKIIATQNFVLNLYVKKRENVVAMPYKFRKFMQLYAQGYKYLILDPQAYISWAKDMKRFHPELTDFLGVIEKYMRPVKVYDHFNDVLLERFVFDHNENLRRSIAFLENNDGTNGQIRIYDVGQCLAMLDQMVGGLKNIKLNPEYKVDRPSDRYGR